MAIGHDLIEAALRRIGRLESGASATTQEKADGVLEFNRMLGRWSAHLGAVFFETTESLTWAASQVSRTIGVSGNLNTARPQQILLASLTISSVDYPLTLITPREYQAIPDKAATSEIPSFLAYNPTNASSQGTLYMYPIPSSAVTLLLTSLKPLADITGAGTITLPPGYEDAIVLNLAVRFADGEFAAQIPQSLRDEAAEAYRVIVQANNETQEMQLDNMAPGQNDFGGRYTLGYDLT